MIHLASARGAIPIEPETIDALALKYRVTPMQMGNEVLKMHLWLLSHESKRPANVWLFISKWMKKAAPAVAHKAPATGDRERRRENMDELTGRQPNGERHTGDSRGVDRASVREVPGNLWEQDGNDVGRLPSRRH
jgi:hypothetical protein